MSVNPKVLWYNLNNPANINYMKWRRRMITKRPYDAYTLAPLDSMTGGSTNDGPAPNRWRLKLEDYGVARRALYAAKRQLV